LIWNDAADDEGSRAGSQATRAIAAKQLAERFQTPFAKRRMMQVVATYKLLAKRAAKWKRAERLGPRPGDMRD
jgi:hypothetical protein